MWQDNYTRLAHYNHWRNNQILNACITLDDAERKADLGGDLGTTDLTFMPDDVQR